MVGPQIGGLELDARAAHTHIRRLHFAKRGAWAFVGNTDGERDTSGFCICAARVLGYWVIGLCVCVFEREREASCVAFPFIGYTSVHIEVDRSVSGYGMSFQEVEKGATLPLLDGKQDPSKAVETGIFKISTSVASFKRLVNTLGTPKDTPELREKLHKTRQHITQLAKETSAKLKAASETDHVTDVSPGKKIADAKLAKDFQAVLKEFQKAQRTAAERETAYAPFVAQAVLPSTYTASELNLSAEDTQVQEHRALLVEQRRQEVILLDNEIVFNEALIEERDQGIRDIQQQIGEVNEIFKDLAVLVHEQGVMIDDIGSNIETSHAATGQANRQLVKAAKSQKSNSSLACLLLVIFGVVLVIVIIVLAT